MDNLIELLTYLVVVSVAAERLVETIKNWVNERHDVSSYTWPALSIFVSIGLAFLAPFDRDLFGASQTAINIIVGIAAAGGAGFWNNILDTMNNFKKSIKKSE